MRTAEMAVRTSAIGDFLRGRRPLILAPHPDDESLGCGGLIAGACAAGLAPLVIILTDGSGSHPGSKAFGPRALARLRAAEARRAAWCLGLPEENLCFFGQGDGALAHEGSGFEGLAARAAALAKIFGCGLVIGPWRGDPHCDHQAAAKIAARVAARCGLEVFFYPVWGWLHAAEEITNAALAAGWRLDISSQQARKAAAIAAHASQHGAVITDAPDAFRLPPALLDVCGRPYEVFIP